MLFEGDRLFAKLCRERNLISDDQLNDAIFVQEKLVSLGLRKKIGEILAEKSYLKPAQLKQLQRLLVYNEVRHADKVLIKVALQNNLVARADVDKALAAQGKLFKSSRGRRAATVGQVLAHLKVISKDQLAQLVQAQQKIRLRNEGITCPLCRTVTVPRDDHCANCGEKVILAFKPDALARLKGYYVKDPEKPASTKEYLVSAAVLISWYSAGAIDDDFLVRPEDGSRWVALLSLAELQAQLATTEVTGKQVFTKVGSSPDILFGREKATHGRMALPKPRAVGLLVAAVLAIAIGAFVLGQGSAGPKSPAYGGPGPGAGGPGPGTNVNGAGGAGEGGGSDTTDGGSIGDSLSLRDLLEQQRDLPPEQTEELLARLGYTRARTPLSNRERWLPADVATESSFWATNASTYNEGLVQFEVDGAQFWVYFDDETPPTPEGDYTGRRWDSGQGVLVDYDVAIEVKLEQEGIWRGFLEAYGSLGIGGFTPQEWLELADYCLANGWYIEARADTIEAFAADADDGVLTDAVIEAVQFLLLSENPNPPGAPSVLPPVLSPSLPYPLVEPRQAGAERAAIRERDVVAPAPPWISFIPPLAARDLVSRQPPGVDPEAQRLRDGNVRYLGAWYPRDDWRAFAAHAGRPQRYVTAESDVQLWTDLPQFGSELVQIVAAIATTTREYFIAHRTELMGALGDGQEPTGAILLAIVNAGASGAWPTWVPQEFEGQAVRLVQADDARDLEGLLPAIAWACFEQYFDSAVRATRAAEAGLGEALAPGWLRAGVAGEFTRRLLEDLRLAAILDVEDALLSERLDEGRTSSAGVSALVASKCDTPRDAALAWALVCALRVDQSATLAALFDVLAMRAREANRRVAAGIELGGATAWHEALLAASQALDDGITQRGALDASSLTFLTPGLARWMTGRPLQAMSAVLSQTSPMAFSRRQLSALARLSVELRALERARNAARRDGHQLLDHAVRARKRVLGAMLEDASLTAWERWLDERYDSPS